VSQTHLLDANALIAITLADHECHERAVNWLASIDRIALCPIVEGSLARFFVRLGQTPATVQQVLRALNDSPRCVFWPDSLSYTDAHMAHVIGHRQVTDAYLASLASANGGLLATFDHGLARAFPQVVSLIP